MISALFLAAVELVLLAGDAQRRPDLVAAAALAGDLDLLHDTLVRLHPGLDRYTPKDEIEAAFRQAHEQLGNGMAVVDFHRLVCGVLAQVHCGHTQARLPELARQKLLEGQGLPPFTVHLAGDRVYADRVHGRAAELPRGARILAIDGRPADAVVHDLLALLSGDGHIETGKRFQITHEFPTLYALFVPGAGASMALDIVPPGDGAGARTVHVPRITAAEAEQLAVRPVRPALSLTVDSAKKVAVLDIRTFGGGLAAGGLDYPKFLEESFARLESEEIEGLIVDLRGNGGGADMFGALLVSYLTDQPFGYFDRIEVTEGYSGPGGIVRAPDGKRLVTTHPGLQRQDPSAHSFLGKVVMLIDGGTFSTAADVATVTHYRKLATFLGEETGGGYDGNTSGSFQTVALPASGIVVGVPLWVYTTANPGHHLSGRGVPPDEIITPSIEDVLSGNDVVMRRARELAAGK